jgi:hypothetical protein
MIKNNPKWLFQNEFVNKLKRFHSLNDPETQDDDKIDKF